MDIAWNIYLTADGHNTVRRLQHDHEINQVNVFEPSQGWYMTINDPEGCGGSVDLVGYLEDELGLDEADVIRVEPVGISEEDEKINALVRELGTHKIWPVFDCCEHSHICIVPALQSFGLVEFQVSNDLPGLRGSSSDVYAYSEAKKIFDEQVVEHLEKY